MLKKILVVDDDEALADNWEDILSDEGYQLLTANTCSDALEIADRHTPHVALLDLKLPDDTGINLLSRLKKEHPECICAMMTAFADVDSAVAALEKGAFHYLQKPVRPIELINLLERIFETLEAREEKKITEDKLKESERRFRTIFESAQDAIYLKDQELRYTLVNPAMERLYKMDSDDFMGKTDEELFGSANTSEALASDRRVLQGKIVEEELLVHGKATQTFHSIRVPLIEKPGKVNGICGFARDITSVKELEAQLLQAQKMEAVGTLAGGISHDFNNLLQAISSYTQMLIMDEDKESPNFSKLKAIEMAALRASELTAQLLTFSRKVEIHPRPINVNHIVKQVEKLLKRTIPKMIEMELDLEHQLQTVNADAGQMEQVLLNIGVNARDAMPDGGRLTFKTCNITKEKSVHRPHLSPKTDEYVLLSIADSGHGMEEDTLKRIFEPFYTTKASGKGTGLGLAMVYGIIQNHGGYIFCDSTIGEGSQFSIYLPVIQLEVPEDEQIQEEEIPQGKGESILFIDDEHYLRELAEEYLTFSGYDVVAVDSGEEGIALYKKKKDQFSVIILDLIMPGMGGKACLKQILEVDPEAKVIICSGHSPDDPETDEILTKAMCFIKKPYDFRKLLKKLQEAVGSPD